MGRSRISIRSVFDKTSCASGAPPSMKIGFGGLAASRDELRLEKLKKNHLTRNLVHRLERLGYAVTLTIQQKAA